MVDEQIIYRGSEAFTDATSEAVKVLEETGRSAAANEIHEALQDISRRPTPDVTAQSSTRSLLWKAQPVT